MNTPTFSLITCVFNRSQELKRLLNSVTLLNHNCSLEVVIVDDCSTDDIQSIVDSFKEQHTDCNVKYHRLQKNSGPGAARNAGVELSNSEYLWFCDSDTEIIHPTILDEVSANFLKYPDVGVMGGELQVFDNVVYHLLYKHYPNLTHWSKFLPLENKEDELPLRIDNDVLSTSNLFMKRSTFNRAGGFKIDLLCLEDYDLGLRIKHLGYKRLIASQTMVIHHHSSKGRSKGRFSFYENPYSSALAYHKSRIEIMCEYYPIRAKFLPLLDTIFIPPTILFSLLSSKYIKHVSGKAKSDISLMGFLTSQLKGLFQNYLTHYPSILFRGKMNKHTPGAQS